MISKVLTKLIDKAIVPAILLLSSRIVATVVVARYLNITFQVERTGFVFDSAASYEKVNSYSALVMVAILLIGIFYILIKSLAFHESHIKPHITSKLFSLHAHSLIQNSFDLYTQGAIWLSYAYLLLIVNGIMTLSNIMYRWVFYVTLGATVLTTVLFILDIEEEIHITKNENAEFDSDKKYLSENGGFE
jgi:hypothetical protein